MKTGLLLDRDFCNHDPGDHHPEAPGRIEAILSELSKEGLDQSCPSLDERIVTDEEVLLAHTDGYLKTVLREIDGSSGQLSTGDTQFGPQSLTVARHAAGGLLNAVDGVVGGGKEARRIRQPWAVDISQLSQDVHDLRVLEAFALDAIDRVEISRVVAGRHRNG